MRDVALYRGLGGAVVTLATPFIALAVPDVSGSAQPRLGGLAALLILVLAYDVFFRPYLRWWKTAGSVAAGLIAVAVCVAALRVEPRPLVDRQLAMVLGVGYSLVVCGGMYGLWRVSQALERARVGPSPADTVADPLQLGSEFTSPSSFARSTWVRRLSTMFGPAGSATVSPGRSGSTPRPGTPGRMTQTLPFAPVEATRAVPGTERRRAPLSPLARGGGGSASSLRAARYEIDKATNVPSVAALQRQGSGAERSLPRRPDSRQGWPAGQRSGLRPLSQGAAWLVSTPGSPTTRPAPVATSESPALAPVAFQVPVTRKEP